MPFTTTVRYALRKMTGATDANTIDDGFAALADDVDAKLTPYDTGTLASRPTSTLGSPGKAGRTYRSTDKAGVVDLDHGTGWVPLAPGPAIGAFSAYNDDSNFTLAASSVQTKVKLAAEDFDQSGWFDTATYRFTPQVAGIYRLGGCIRLVDALGDGDALILRVYKNGSEAKQIAYDRQSGTLPFAVAGSALLAANGSTDYFELWAEQGFSSARRLSSGAALTYFQGELVGRT